VNRALRFTLLGLAVVVVVSGRGQAHPGRLHMHELRAAVVAETQSVNLVRVRAKVCLPSKAEALETFPDELRLTQFFVSQGHWRPLRVLIDPNPQWLVPFGETWNGACGWVRFEDLWKYPEGFAGFGSAINCVGVAFSIRVDKSRATKRTTIRCGGRR